MDYPVNLSAEEKAMRKTLVNEMRALICRVMSPEDQTETSVLLVYDGFHLQISFSDVHPLMVFQIVKPIGRHAAPKDLTYVNALNIKSVLGTHALNMDIHCYTYKSTHWLCSVLDERRFFEILNRCVEEAKHGYMAVAMRTAII